MSEPHVMRATVREVCAPMQEHEYSVECHFSDGQKFAAVHVDGDFPELAGLIAEFLNGGPQHG